ncbi:S-adenosyl-L-methionine-dependent methyltransferase [Mollisia scopiformis]|uniref:S-adenosyl-L-methionine-dependent methyltransferase n=1 Tax=Mollisia scopiformis TaxID=149040 RepID=A0A194WZK2_MOLSC|nr:S-adenosyl-L-methionine-dependent methyltransferase [Mollisia scopiformis]KUJ13139.1 S-adenosyl-L-methionine-dependent methyltransferase [Mollisia scopiformis]
MAPDLSIITGEIQQKSSELRPGNEKQRLSLLQSARALVHELEQPHERIMRMCYHEPAIFMATKVLINLGIFKILAAATEQLTAAKLAQDTGSDKILVERLLKHIATEFFVHESGPDTYTANDLTRCIASSGGQGTIEDMFQIVRVVDSIPDFLRGTNYANPVNKDATAWKFAYKTDQHYFEYVNSPGREQNLEAFRKHMSFKTVGLKWYEVPEIMKAVFGDADGVGKNDVLLIDVGGSGGHDLIGFHEAHPSMPGRLILQDLPTTIQSLDSAALAQQSIEPMGHDFFTPQPIHGAKAYYLKMVLHDWPTQQCIQILSQLKPALKHGYSRILLNEIVVPETNAGWFETSVDLLMMEVHSAQERREAEWKSLVDAVGGLRVKQIWNVEGAVEKLIEIEAL